MAVICTISVAQLSGGCPRILSWGAVVSQIYKEVPSSIKNGTKIFLFASDTSLVVKDVVGIIDISGNTS